MMAVDGDTYTFFSTAFLIQRSKKITTFLIYKELGKLIKSLKNT